MNYDYKKLTPFKWYVLQNFPFIDEDFDAITNYQLFCKLGEEINKVINSQNLVGEQVENLTNAFNDLKEYVENYISHLDIQTDVDNKIDEMVTDGTFDTIINQEIFGELNEQVSTNTENISTNTTAIENINTYLEDTSFINKIRRKYNNLYNYVELPSDFDIDFFKQLNIYNNGKKYVTDLDVSELKNKNSTHTYYVSPNGNNENNGLTRETPFFSLQYAYAQAVSGDTIILLEGIYNRQNAINNANPQLKRSLNIIGEGRVILTQRDDLVWTPHDLYDNVYQATRSLIYEVIDFSNIDNNSTLRLRNVATLAECAENENTYYYENNVIYVHMYHNNVPSSENIDCPVIIGGEPLIFSNQSENLNIYLENIIVLDGYKSNLVGRNYNGYTCRIVAKNCKFFNSLKTVDNQDAVCLQGADGIFQNCIASFSGKDGFNYHALNGIISKGIEINCQGSYNGLKNSDNAYNGSTAHDGCKVLRIGGIYHDNKGPNVADVQNNTASVNYDCIAYDSKADTTTHSDSDFYATQGTAKIFLNNCYCKGSTSHENLVAFDGATIYTNNTKYDTYNGNIVNND